MQIHQVVKRMRELTDNGIPFSMDYVTLNQTNKQSNGLVKVERALLRPARRTKTVNLLSYTDVDSNEPRHVHLPLITKFNGKLITNGN
ncbi:hypothetical protein [Bizionia paragorgiae]|uniref:hypothetical protein n=2 Tax=Flavobacteriaceae TaxID=49546 RepID=UPI003A90AB4D